ncbi:nitrate- and nitrite sensing domain-containing protein [Actinocrispum wychmicini]|uniref:histidine kinase n=1 Tax=Actinocrispum wychmicini TaxID=1213861 RepID=A0A4R2JPM2_9PSEU|nr:nitrate- and nitrite sensing domain-containing protein [Actinocrispum wychmicini]TCO60722.1 HAMP domain-containing protein [Actinocrispum wychmicini]
MPGKPPNSAEARSRRTPLGAGRRNSRYRLRNWPLRSKQLVVILVPTLTALLLGYLRISTEVDKADEFSRTVSQVDLSATVAEVVHELQGERDLVVGRVASGKADDRSAVTAQINRVDSAVTDLRGQAGSITDLDQAVRTRYDKVVAGLDALVAVRTLAEQTKYPAGDILFAYQGVIGDLLQLAGEITRVSNERTITEQAARFDAIANAKEQMAIQDSILRAAALADEFGPGQLDRLRSAQAEFNAQLTAFREAADPAASARYSNTVAGFDVDNRLRLIQIALNRGEAGAAINISVSQLDLFTSGTLSKIRNVEIASLEDLRTTALGLITTARSNALRDAAFILVALVIALLLMLMVAWSLLKPLRVLRRDALDAASRRLPATVQRILADPNPLEASKDAVDPVPVFTTEEVGQVARSFDAVQHQAVRMATEQAILRDNINSIFVNLSRRSQTLVERQLALIDLLERDETDPDQLSHLFKLDHLATRMRRNSESLLVLSGTGLSRQMNRAVPVDEVIGAAVSEVEQYKRIVVQSAPPVQVLGKAVSDLVHLIAELLDNATFFSGPEQQVRVRMVATRARDLVVQITDNGVGMTQAEIEVANQRLGDPPDLDVAVTRRMGLYVVARLAQKHNITVRLRENEDLEGGLITRVTVPAELISYIRSTGTQPVVSSGSFERPVAGPPSFPATLFDDPRPSPGVFDATSTMDRQSTQPDDSATQRLPIYEEVLSQWFVSDPEPRDEPAEADADASSSWVSPGDEGWLAARTMLSNGGEHLLNENGLPKRIPKARLIPGSAPAHRERDDSAAEPSPGTRVTLPRRSAQLTRGRMDSLQRGLQRARTEVTGGQEVVGDEQHGLPQ